MARPHFLIPAVLLLIAAFACGQTSSPAAPVAAAPVTATPANSALAAPAFDVNAAVDAYLAKMPPAQRARSNAYFEGGYWLLLWDFLVPVFVMWLLLRFRWSAGMRDLAERITRFRPLQTAIYWIQFIVVTSVLTFPHDDVRRLFSRAQVWPAEPDLRPLDARSAGGARLSAWCWERF